MATKEATNGEDLMLIMAMKISTSETFIDFRREARDGGPLTLTTTNSLEFIANIVATTSNAMMKFGLMDRATLIFSMTIYLPRPNIFVNDIL